MNIFEPNKLLNYDDNSLVEEVRRVYLKYYNSSQMTTKQFDKYSRVSASTVTKRFGSWFLTLEKADLVKLGAIRLITASLIKNDLERVILLNNGEYFTLEFYKNNGGLYSESTIKRYFENKKWPEILASEFSLYPIRKIIIVEKRVEVKTEEELFDEIKKVWNKFGRRPTYSEFRKEAKFGTKIYEKRYGSWTKTIELFCASNINYKSSSKGIGFKTTKELLIQELKKIVQDNNLEILNQGDYENYGGKYNVQTFYNHFGSWKKAKIAAGLKIGRAVPKKEELFSELQMVWEKLGRQPSKDEMTEYSQYKYSTYVHVFGKWTKAIYSFIEYLQEDNQGEIQQEISDTAVDKLLIEEEVKKTSRINNENAKIIKMKTPRTVSTRLRFKVFMRDEFTCQYCGKKPIDGIKLEADHIVAYSNGGETILENLKTACWACNNGKSNETL